MYIQRRNKRRVKKVANKNVEDFQQLLQNHKNFCNTHCRVVDDALFEHEYVTDQRVSPCPVTLRKSESLEKFQENRRTTSEDIINTNTASSKSSTISGGELKKSDSLKRRTWGRLSSSLFDALFMPSIDTTTTEDDGSSTTTLANLQFEGKVETTV